VIGLMSGIFDSRKNILAFEERVVFEDLFKTRTGTQEFQNVGHSDSHSTEAWAAATLVGVVRDAINAIRSHDSVPETSLAQHRSRDADLPFLILAQSHSGHPGASTEPQSGFHFYEPSQISLNSRRGKPLVLPRRRRTVWQHDKSIRS
jgi:hypothetical protein